MVGTTLLTLGAISAGAHALGAWNSSRAANKAGKQQAAGADRAARAVDDSYRTQMGLMDPYAALGRQSANTLGRLMQPGVGYSPQMQAADAAAFQMAPRQWADPASGMPPAGMAVPRGTGMTPAPFMPFAGSGGLGRMMPPRPSPMFEARRRTMGGLMPRRAA